MTVLHRCFPLNHSFAWHILCANVLLAGLTTISVAAEPPAASDDAESRQPTPRASVVDAGKITQVTLFRDSALVTRSISLSTDQSLAPGSHEVLVTKLPEQLVTSSVFAEGDESISIRAVRVLQEPIGESSRADVQKIDEQFTELKLELDRMTTAREVTQGNLTTLDQMIAFTRQASGDDLNHGVLNAEALTNLLDYSMKQRAELNEKLLDIENETQELNERQALLSRERSRLTDSHGHTRYEARVFIDVRKPKTDDAANGEEKSDAIKRDADDTGHTIRLSYSVGGCGWSPQYTVNGSVESDQFTLRYGAIIGQLSGETWDQVRLTLSTSSPQVSAAGPSLAPLRVRTTFGDDSSDASLDDLFGGPSQPAKPQSNMQMEMGAAPQRAMPSQLADSGSSYGGSGSSPLQSKMQSLRSQQRSVEQSVGKGMKSNEAAARDVQLNRLADEMQGLEFMASVRKARGLASDAADEVASQTYVIDGPVSLDSRREQQLVKIVEKDLTGELYHVAIPLLSSFAYLEAELVNELPFGLLSGPASIYLDDRFVGMMTMPTAASKQKLLIGFGADGQVRTRRELVEKTDAIQGGNRKLGFEYRLVLTNFKEREVKVRLLDRIPLSSQAEQIRVTLGDVSTPLSEDKLFERVQKPFGLLRWDLTLGKSTYGSDATDVTYSYGVEFDRSQVLSVEATSEKDVTEFDMGGGMGGGMGGSMGR